MDAEHVGMRARWFNLTLVKGDEGVEAGEQRADRALLGEGGYRDGFFHQVIGNKLVHHRAAFRGFYENLPHRGFAGHELFPERIVLLDDWSQAGKAGRHKPITCCVDDKTAIGMDFIRVPLKRDVADSNNLVILQRVLRRAISPIECHSSDGKGAVVSEGSTFVALVVYCVQFPQLTLFPSGIRLRCFCVFRLVRQRGRMLRFGRVGSHADVRGGGSPHLSRARANPIAAPWGSR